MDLGLRTFALKGVRSCLLFCLHLGFSSNFRFHLHIFTDLKILIILLMKHNQVQPEYN